MGHESQLSKEQRKQHMAALHDDPDWRAQWKAAHQKAMNEMRPFDRAVQQVRSGRKRKQRSAKTPTA